MLPEINNADLLPFNFEGIRLQEACFINGNPYFTAKAIGEFLGYVKPRPDKAIRKIVDRNPHILTFSSDTRLVSELDTGKGKKYIRESYVRVFDPIGLQLIINKSNQPKAIAFQIAVAHLVLAFMKGELKPSKWSFRGDRVSAIRQILSLPSTFKRKIFIDDLANRENVHSTSVYRWLDRFGGLKTKKGYKKHNSAAGTTKYPGLKEAAQFVKAQMPSYGPKRIAAVIGRPDFFENIKRWLKVA